MAIFQQLSNLKVGGDAHSNAARQPDGVTGEKTAEVDNVKNIRKVLSVNLKLHIHTIRLVNLRAHRRIDLKRRVDAACSKVNSI